MNIYTTIIIALALSMDAFAVSIAHGTSLKSYRTKNAMTLGIFFGAFQALMPVLGWTLGFSFKSYIEAIDHWIAFGLLLIIGLKMIIEALKGTHKEELECSMKLGTLFLLAIATSIDAFAIGITFSVLNINILWPIIIIGIITFINSFIGVFVGNKFGTLFGKRIEILGGLILITIGTKILIEHLM